MASNSSLRTARNWKDIAREMHCRSCECSFLFSHVFYASITLSGNHKRTIWAPYTVCNPEFYQKFSQFFSGRIRKARSRNLFGRSREFDKKPSSDHFHRRSRLGDAHKNCSRRRVDATIKIWTSSSTWRRFFWKKRRAVYHCLLKLSVGSRSWFFTAIRTDLKQF